MKFKNQVLTQTTGTVVLMFSQWLISVLLVRLGGFADAGIFSLAMSVANVFTAIADGGIRSYLISDVKGEFLRSQYIFARAGMVLVSFSVFGCYLLAERNTYSSVEQMAILLYLLYANINSLSDIRWGALQMREKLYVNGFSNSARGILGATFFLGIYAISHDLLLAIGMLALDALVMFAFYDSRKYRLEFGRDGMPDRKDFAAVAHIIRKCLPLLIISLCGLILTALPRRTINVKLGNEQLGYFSSLFAPAALISTVGNSIVYSLVPKLSDKWQRGDRKGFIKLIGGCYGCAVSLTVASELFAVIAGRPVLRLIFGDEIMPYYSLFYVAILSYGLSTMSGCGYSLLVSLRKTKTLMSIAVTGMLFMAFSVGPAIDKAGITGAGLTLVAAFILQCSLHICVVLFQMKRRFRR